MSDKESDQDEYADDQSPELNSKQQFNFQMPLDDDSNEENVQQDDQNDEDYQQMMQNHQHQAKMQGLQPETDMDEEEMMMAYQDQQNQMQDMLVQKQNNYAQGYDPNQQYQEMQPQRRQTATGSRQKFLSDDQQKHVLRKAMILDKADRKKTEIDLKLEVEELKKMRNKDIADIKMLKVELNKLEQMFKKYKDAGGFTNQSVIQLPDTYVNTNQYNDPDQGIIDTSMLIDDMNFVKNQFQCEVIKMKSNGSQSTQSKIDNFFKQRNLTISESNANNGQSSSSHHGGGKLVANTQSNFQNQSSVRLQINTLKSKCKLLQESIEKKDQEIAKIKSKNGSQNQGMEEKTKNELKRAYVILKQLKKRLRDNQMYNGQTNPVNIYEQEYNQIIGQIQSVLGIQKRNGGVNIQEDEEYEIVNDQDGYMEGNDGDDKEDEDAQEDNKENTPQKSPGQADSDPNEEQSILDLKQKIQDLKSELEMSPRQFEDKLLHKLREEIIISKQQMQEQLQAEIEMERQRVQRLNTGNKRKDDLQSANRHLQNEVYRLKNVLKKSPAVKTRK